MPPSPLRVAADHILSTNGSTRGTAYSMSNKLVRLGDQLFAGWLDSGGICMIRSLDLNTGALSDPFALGQTEVKDNHCGPAIVATSDGHLHAIVGSHNRPFRYRKTLRPADITGWTDEPAFAPDSTYPSLAVGPDDTLHLVGRAWLPPGRSESCKLVYQKRKGDSDWSDPIAVCKTPSPTGYVHYGGNILCDPAGTLHLTFHMYHGDPPESPIQGYLRSDDEGETWIHSDGTKVDLPAITDTCEVFAKNEDEIFRGGQSIARDVQGRLYVLVTGDRGTNLIYRLNGPGDWQVIELGPHIDRFFPGRRSPQEGNITFGRDGMLYVCLDMNDPEAQWGDPCVEVLLLASSDCGETFTGLPITQPDPTVPHWLSNMERSSGLAPIGGPPAILYTAGFKGEGCAPNEKTEIHLVILQEC